jgi:hypothetical protein
VIFTGQHHFGAERLAGLDDARIVGGNHHAAGAAFARLFPDVLIIGLPAISSSGLPGRRVEA